MCVGVRECRGTRGAVSFLPWTHIAGLHRRVHRRYVGTALTGLAHFGGRSPVGCCKVVTFSHLFPKYFSHQIRENCVSILLVVMYASGEGNVFLFP